VNKLISEIENIYRQVLKEQGRIPYTQEGFSFLLKEMNKLLPEQTSYSLSIEDLDEFSAEDRLLRRLPKITISIKRTTKETNESVVVWRDLV